MHPTLPIFKEQLIGLCIAIAQADSSNTCVPMKRYCTMVLQHPNAMQYALKVFSILADIAEVLLVHHVAFGEQMNQVYHLREFI